MACKTFDELKTFWAENYNVKVADSLKELHFLSVREAMSGVEAAIKLMPETGKYLREMVAYRSKPGILATYSFKEMTFKFSRAKFLPENIKETLDDIKWTGDNGTIARNSTIYSIATHEMGHAANNAIANHLGMTWRYRNEAEALFIKDVHKRMPAAERKRGIRKLRAEISEYAKKPGETVPEALNDYFANGGGAASLSKAVAANINEAMTGEGFLERAVLSKGRLDLPSASLDNVVVRKWYKWHDERIYAQIDESMSLEEKAKQAFELRNKYREEARGLMSDKKLRKELDEKYPNKTWEEMVADKMRRKNLSYEEALEDIYRSASKTNAGVNRRLGLE